MSHIDESDSELPVHFLELYLHILAHLEVERCERLVKQKHLRLIYDGSGNGYTLLLTS